MEILWSVITCICAEAAPTQQRPSPWDFACSSLPIQWERRGIEYTLFRISKLGQFLRSGPDFPPCSVGCTLVSTSFPDTNALTEAEWRGASIASYWRYRKIGAVLPKLCLHAWAAILICDEDPQHCSSIPVCHSSYCESWHMPSTFVLGSRYSTHDIKNWRLLPDFLDNCEVGELLGCRCPTIS